MRAPRRRARLVTLVTLCAVAGLAAACGHAPRGIGAAASAIASASAGPGTPSAAPSTASPGPPAFSSSVSNVTAADLPSTWRSGCPVGPAQLRMLHLTYWSFDGRPHDGTIVVRAEVTAEVIRIFGILYTKRFPIRQMQPVDAYNGSDTDSMAADNTSGFNCRYAVAPGPPQWSAHAFGEAIDVNTVENPYVQGGNVMPPAGRDYLDRSHYRTGMAVAHGELVAAFAVAGWQWGGRWTSAPDYQHFSRNGG
jgi:hypothetical protein